MLLEVASDLVKGLPSRLRHPEESEEEEEEEKHGEDQEDIRPAQLLRNDGEEKPLKKASL